MLRIKLRYDDVEVMVQRFAANVGKSGLFLPTRSLQPIGAEIKFELRLADDTAVLVGQGRVKAANAHDPHNPRAAAGLAIELMRVTPQSRALILRMLQRRRELGLPEVGLPTAADVDAARRSEVESGPVHVAPPTSGPIPVAVPPTSGPIPVAVPPTSGPVPVAASPSAVVAPAAAPIGEGLLTAPRRTTGPIAVASVAAIAPLPPEPPRKRRTPLSELIERASGPTAAAVPGLDDNVDIAATIARARALAGGSPDDELDALSEAAAAPIEISIEAASAELAKQLGGSAVRRDRSAGWAPPPATSSHLVAAALAGEPGALRLGSEPGEPDDAAPPLPAIGEPSASGDDAPVPGIAEPSAFGGDEPVQAMAAPSASDEDEPVTGPSASDEPAVDAAAPAAPETDDDRIDDALAELDSDERTELGDRPAEGGGFELPADADEEDDEEDEQPRGHIEAREPPLELGVDEFDDFEILAEADADDEDLLASSAEHDAAPRRRAVRPATAERRPSELDFASRLDLGDDSDRYTAPSADDFSAHHVIDSAPDELTGQHHASRPRIDARSADPYQVSAGKALAALEADEDAFEDDAEVTDDPDAYAHRRVVQPIFEPESSSSVTLAGAPSESIDVDPPSQRRGGLAESRPARGQPARSEPRPSPYPEPWPATPPEPRASQRSEPRATVRSEPRPSPYPEPRPTVRPEPRPSPYPEPRSAARPEPRASQRPEPRASQRPEPAMLRHSPLSLHDGPVEDYELEHALEALDVDLDDLSIPHAATQLQRDASRPSAAPQPRATVATPSRPIRPSAASPGSGRVSAPRAPSEGSIDIDFDDDD